MVDALERLRLEDPAQLPRCGYWDLLHQMRADLWCAQARVNELEVALRARSDEEGKGGRSPTRAAAPAHACAPGSKAREVD